MSQFKIVESGSQEDQENRGTLETLLRGAVQRMVQATLEAEVTQYVKMCEQERDSATGHRLVVRNGRMPSRELQTGLGPIPVQQPRVRDRRAGQKFTSQILPPYMRRLPSIEALISVLYLKGVSTNDFPEVLKSILGEQAAGLSPATIVRLKQVWEQEYLNWEHRNLAGKRYVYFWADGIHFNVRLTDERPCVLVILGATEDGRKELVALRDGERESKLSWVELLQDLKRRGLKEAPKLATGDGALGFWAALEEVFPQTRQQRCWVHKTANVLEKMPDKVQPGAKKLLHEMYESDTKANALEAFEAFLKTYQAKFPRACECLAKDKETLFTFYDFPAEHWLHIRTTNPIESAFATVRHRHRQTKGCGSRSATLAMAFKLALEAEKHWRRLNGQELIPKLIQGIRFEDGVQVQAA